ncbi:GNAT family N-acetyltransferase [Halobacillus sp. Nhm2S1]|uniref:GNAT family N-acetyltransferase n=1 Tax=Halobacillus sp. Nhm2S1 TaxID=2866716 RepID=UPI001C72C7C0|nr:GNAT family protein [Halobacillus sp. Nhm2S1]MBX0357950.1 GNAT family N-acetyltransferase [Halobacillus sp. Nhm2S1]
MKVQWTPITQQDAEEIAGWKYPDPYNFYDMTADEEDLELFVNPEKRSPHTYSAHVNGELIGFMTLDLSHHPTIDIGLGMHPDEAGKGKGESFVNSCLSFAAERCQAAAFTLSVATFNKRAIAVYERVGFIKKQTFMQATNGGHYEFLSMEK